jgi:amino acid transporter
MHKLFLALLVATVALAAAMAIGQMWFSIFSADVFFKALATLAILFVVFGFFMVVKSDFGSFKKLKDQNYLD